MSETLSLTLTDVPGVQAGHWTHESTTTGCTAVVFAGGARGGVAVPGHAPGSRELGTLSATHLADTVHGLVLSGGSAFGLAAADGAVVALSEAGIGLAVGDHTVPIVPAAILFDLPVAAVRPGAAEGRCAAEQALRGGPLPSGPVGAGAGARVGKAWGNVVRGGFGQAGRRVGSHLLAAGVATNAFGGVWDPSTARWVAGGPAPEAPQAPLAGGLSENTTLVVVAMDAPLTKPQCTVVAQMATAGLARTLSPVFSPFDGDTVFVAATGPPEGVNASAVLQLGQAAADAVAAAVLRSVSPRS